MTKIMIKGVEYILKEYDSIFGFIDTSSNKDAMRYYDIIIFNDNGHIMRYDLVTKDVNIL